MFFRRALTQVLRSEGAQQAYGGGGGGARLKANLNKVMLMGTVGRDPRAIPMGTANKVTFSVATNESYRTKEGELKVVTEWHNVAVYQEKLANFVMSNIQKGAQVYVEGSISSSKYTSKDGVEKQVYEIRINPFQGNLKILSRSQSQQQPQQETYVTEEGSQKAENEDYAY